MGLSISVGLTVGSWEIIIALILICCNSLLIRQRPNVLGLLTAAITGIGIDRTGFFFNFKEGELTIVVLNINKHAEKMVAIAFEMTEMDSDMRVLDLFCGIGTFSLPFANAAKELVGIELVEQSIVSAKENAKKAGLTNTLFFASDARKGLEELKETWTTPDLLVINPPRGGAGGKMMRSVGRYGSKNIIYISCNPKTLADDLQWLGQFGYEFIEAQPIDQFPHTVHVEAIVKLERRQK